MSSSWTPRNGGIELRNRPADEFDDEVYSALIDPSRTIAPRLAMDFESMSETRKHGVFTPVIDAFDACRRHDIPLGNEVIVLAFECDELGTVTESELSEVGSLDEALATHSITAPVLLDVTLGAILTGDVYAETGPDWIVHHVHDDLPLADFLLPIHPLVLHMSQMTSPEYWDVKRLYEYCKAILERLTQASLNDLAMDARWGDETYLLDEFRNVRALAARAHAAATDRESAV